MMDHDMTCEQLCSTLIDFHFGAVTRDQRAAITAHLVGCASCVADLLAVKADIELSADADERAPESLHVRVARGANAHFAGADAAGRSRRRWERPVVAAFAVAAVLAAWIATGAVARTDGQAPYAVRAAVTDAAGSE